MADRNVITLANLAALERLMNGIFATYGQGRSGGVPLYMTEWGYKTNPPNPFVHTTLDQQAAWLNQGEYITFREPYVRALTQFELVDTGPKAGESPVGSIGYWSTFQTGLMFQDGSPKPSMAAFRIPIWLPRSPPRRFGRGLGPAAPRRPLDGAERGDRVPAPRRRRLDHDPRRRKPAAPRDTSSPTCRFPGRGWCASPGCNPGPVTSSSAGRSKIS